MPITFDYHHHMFHPDGLNEYEALQMAADTWPSDVRQCTHYSECRTHEKQRDFLKTLNEHNVNMEDIENWPTLFERKQRIDKIRKQAHSDFIYDEIRTYGMDFDIVVEAKAKELAVLHYRHIYPKSETKVYNERQRKHTETA
jgi:UV DNA damage endonuclease